MLDGRLHSLVAPYHPSESQDPGWARLPWLLLQLRVPTVRFYEVGRWATEGYCQEMLLLAPGDRKCIP